MIQLVSVKWGGKYGADHVNRMYRAAKRQTGAAIKFVCITDRPDEGYDTGIEVKAFPRFAVPLESLKGGCRAKLAIFAPGMLEPGLPTIYVDLDTIVRGDVERLADQLRRRPGLYMLPNHHIQFWPIQKYLRAFVPNRYYFGNSSILAFYPERFHWLFEEFNRTLTDAKPPLPKYLRSDERFMSRFGRDDVRVFPRRLATKFAEEYMLPFVFLEELRKRLPWVAARRRSLVAITFVGSDFKPDRLAALKKGEIVRYKRLKHRWDHDEYADYWKGQA